MWSCDPRRFTGFEDHDYCVEKGMEVYGHEYAIQFPHHAWPAGRSARCSAVHDRTTALGAQFGPYNGWERALWYARPGDDISEAAQQTWAREGPWFARRARGMRGGARRRGHPRPAGLQPLPSDGPGRGRLARRADHRAGAGAGAAGPGLLRRRRGPHRHRDVGGAAGRRTSFLLITAATAQSHDREWLRAHLGARPDPRRTNADWSCQILTGPHRRDMLLAAGDRRGPVEALAHPPDRPDRGAEVPLLRVSFAGELGWEIHSRLADTPAVWDAVMAAGAPLGLKPFGMFALNSLRIEKGYRAWKGDLSHRLHRAAGRARALRGLVQARLPRQGRARAPRSSGASPSASAPWSSRPGDFDPPYMSTIWHDGTGGGRD